MHGSGSVVTRAKKQINIHRALQGVAFLGPSLFFTLAANLGGGGAENETLTVGQ